jgi:hypothetical protein
MPTYKIYEPKSHERGKYIALSYCWGISSSRILLTSNLADLKQEIPSDMMPACFKDAVLIAKRLNIPYLWVDTMCIVQNDRVDWEIESSKMAEVYRNAAFVIAASSSSNLHESFLVSKDEYYNPVTLDCVITDGDASTTFKARPQWVYMQVSREADLKTLLRFVPGLSRSESLPLVAYRFTRQRFSGNVKVWKSASVKRCCRHRHGARVGYPQRRQMTQKQCCGGSGIC